MSRYILIRRLRGPAILLLIGIIALLHQMGVVEHFARMFVPMLFIVLGLLLLAERMALTAEGGIPPYPGTGYPGVPYQGAGYPSPVNPGGAPAAAPTQETGIVRSSDFNNDPNGGQS